MKLNKVLLSIVLASSMILSPLTYPIYAQNELTSGKDFEKLQQKRIQEQNNPDNIPITIISSGIIEDVVKTPSIIMTQKINGEAKINRCHFKKDLVITAKNLKKLTIKDSTINGNIYVVEAPTDLPIIIENSKIQNIYMDTPANIIGKGTKYSINDIITTKDLKSKAIIKIDANINNFVNHSKNLKVVFNGNMNSLVVNEVFDISGNYDYKVKKTDKYAYPDTVLYDISQFGKEKGYKDISDNTSYADLYNLLKKEQYNYNDKITILVKNLNEQNIKNLNNQITDKLSKFVPTHLMGLYTTIYSDSGSQYGIYNIYFLYDSSMSQLQKSMVYVDVLYDKIKHLNGADYVRELNKQIALRIVYDESLKKHSMYDAIASGSAVCDGYAKLAYELLSKKFGSQNNILIANNDHMWNMLKLNNKWYHIDFTHNDPVTKPLNKSYYTEKFLLLSDSDIKQRSQDGRSWDYLAYPKAETSYKF